MHYGKIISKRLVQGACTAFGIKVLYDNSAFRHQIAYCADGSKNKSEKLVGLLLITRHGARTPLSLIDGIEEQEYTPQLLEPHVVANYKLVDLNGNDFTEESRIDSRHLNKKLKGGAGFGQLTTVGERQMFDLGRQLRQKYVRELKFLSEDYNPNEIYIRSSHFRRTVNSAKSLLAGLYLDSHLVTSNNPFLIHTCENSIDFLFPNTKNCQYIQDFYKLGLHMNDTKLNREYIDFLKKFGDQVGRDISLEFLVVLKNLDDLAARLAHGKHVPENLSNLLEKFHHFSLVEMKADIKPKMQLFFGQFMNLMKNNLVHIANKDASHMKDFQKVLYYSAHDTTMNGILLGLDLIDEDSTWPPFAANIIIELWKDTESKASNYFIRFYYCGKLVEITNGNSNKNDTSKCSLEDFVRLLDKYSIDKAHYDEICRIRLHS